MAKVDSNVRIFWDEITPELAEEYMAHNFEKNRSLRKQRVRTYAQDMKDGRWDPYASGPIVISDTGKVMDGQHRLAAIIASGVTLCTEMRVNVPESTYRKFDCGMNRTVSDGVPADTKHKSAILAACRTAIAIAMSDGDVVTAESMNTGGSGKTASFITNANVCEFFDKCNELHPGVLEEAGKFATSVAIRSAKWTPKSVAVSALAMMITDADTYSEFRDAILDEANTMVSVIAYRKWANDHCLKNYDSVTRTFIEWCAAANIWNELHGHTPRKIAYKKGVTSELVGFKPEMLDLLGFRKREEETQE